MRCLTDVELQAYVDGEAEDALVAHVTGCAACRARADARRADIARLVQTMHDAADLPAGLTARIHRAVTTGQPVAGSTTLRPSMPAPAWRRAGWVSGLATAAAIAIVAFVVLPRLGAPATTTLSAAQILGRSLQTISNAHGIESLDYELVVDGVTHGAWRIEQIIDYDQPTRFRVAAYGPDGTLQSAFSQDPQAQRRTQLVRSDERNYLVTAGPIPGPVLSVPQMMQAVVETVITAMLAKSDQALMVVNGPAGPEYVIEMPSVAPRTPASTLELYRARVVVNGADYRIREFEASGALLRQPFSISFKLIRHSVWNARDVPASEFEIRPGPDDVVLQGAPSDEGPAGEFVDTILRELTRARGR